MPDSVERIRILLVEDNLGDALLVKRYLEKAKNFSFDLEHVTHLSAALDLVSANHFDVILLDLSLPDGQGFDGVVAPMQQAVPDTAIVVFTALDDLEMALKVMREGAQDYLAKAHISTEILTRTIRYAIERKRTAIELEERNHELAAFSSVASHDLKAPLRRIVQLTGLLKRAYDAGKPQDIAARTDLITNQAQAMLTLVDSLLEFARTGHQDKPFEPVDLALVMRNAITNLEINIQESDAEVSFDALPTVLGNAIQLTQLFQNLISNGIKYQRDNKPQVRISAAKQDKNWWIAIKDNGIGIALEHQKKIFEPLKRLHAQNEFSGTGIGLATCKRIMDQHQGKIWIESEPETGSTFFCSFKDPQPSHTPLAHSE